MTLRAYVTSAVSMVVLLAIGVALLAWDSRAALVLLGPWRAQTWGFGVLAVSASIGCLFSAEVLTQAWLLVRALGVPLGAAFALAALAATGMAAVTVTDIVYLPGEHNLVAEKECFDGCSVTIFAPAGAGYRRLGTLADGNSAPFIPGAYRIEHDALRYVEYRDGPLTGWIPLDQPSVR